MYQRSQGENVILRCREFPEPTLDKTKKRKQRKAAKKRKKKRLEISGFRSQI